MRPHLAFFLAVLTPVDGRPLILLLFFLLTIWLLYLAIQQLCPSPVRRALAMLHVLAAVATIKLSTLPSTPFQPVLVPFLVTGTLQTICTLYIECRVVDLGTRPISQRLRAVYRISTNIRRLRLSGYETPDPTASHVNFAWPRSGRSVFLLAMYWLGNTLVARAFRLMQITLSDFHRDKQGFLPSFTLRDMCLRAIISTQWIWSSYSLLGSAHDLLAVLLVSVLRWDQPDEWPLLFGSIADATSLRRFWGRFWHRLHVPLFDSYMNSTAALVRHLWFGNIATGHRQQQLAPTPLPRQQQQQRQPSRVRSVFRKVVRALSIFCMSAACHAASNRVMMGRASVVGEFRFFLSNFLICLVETIFEWGFLIGERHLLQAGAWKRLLGYIWTMLVVFSLAPAWQFPLIRATVGI
ncbi:hypothetical protein B0I37DRAFT_358775 [Chaetomium sp. MPI-CAGE-AT-0009]|nr:hypothetical protein B0I37DRAFT_358775 [Chaetomium sp. MPI-CAGE-AT-0009]